VTTFLHRTDSSLTLVLDVLIFRCVVQIAHCDLKPDNFLFKDSSDNSVLKIIDFGMAKFLQPRKYFTYVLLFMK